MKTLIKSGRIVTAVDDYTADVLIEDETISTIGKSIDIDVDKIIDASNKLVYHGRIDESQDDAKNVKSPDLRNALDAVLAGKPVATAQTKAFGCSIKRV